MNAYESKAGFVARISKTGYFVRTANGVTHSFPDGESPLTGVVDVALFGDLVIAASYSDGVRAYSFDGRVIWSIPGSAFPSELFSMLADDTGPWITGYSNLVHVLRPDLYSYRSLASGQPFFLMATHDGPIFSTTKGFSRDGMKPASFQNLITAYAQSSGGEEAIGGWSIQVWGRKITMPGRNVYSMAFSDEDTLAALKQDALWLHKRDGGQSITNMPVSPSSLAWDGVHYFVGSENGVLIFDKQGKLLRRWGSGTIFTQSVPDLVIWSRTGVFSKEGELLYQPPPGGSFISVVLEEGRYTALVRFPDHAAVGALPWAPYDVPGLPVTTQIIAGRGSDFYFLAPDLVGHFPLRLAALPDLTNVPDRTVLPPDLDFVDFQLPAGRSTPWPKPSYRLSVGAAAPLTNKDGIFRIERLAFGKTPLTAEVSFLGTTTRKIVMVERARPWWLAWPGILLGLSGGLASVFGFVRWRTGRLTRRTRELEAAVAERTVRLVEAQAARERFFAMMSHELRNPLNGVLGLSDALGAAPPSAVAPRERFYIETLRGCADQLRRLLDTFLDYTRATETRQRVVEEVFELTAAVGAGVAAIDPLGERTTLVFPTEAVWLRGDVGKLRQVVTNFVSNALKYGRPNRACIEVSAVKGGETGHACHVRIAVRNEGPTVSAGELTTMLAGFSRGAEAQRRGIPGAGLGLAIVQRLALALGAKIGATSAEGLTEFYIELSLATAEPLVAQTPSVELQVAVDAPRVLVVEDEPYNRLVLEHRLRSLGCAAVCVRSAEEALAVAEPGAYVLGLTDVMLPDMDGIELVRRWRERHGAKLPWVAVTAFDGEDTRGRARAAGLIDLLSKPVSTVALRDMLIAAGIASPSGKVAEEAVPEPFARLIGLPEGAEVVLRWIADAERAATELRGVAEGLEATTNMELAARAHRLRSLAGCRT